jgi:hypothetical protein
MAWNRFTYVYNNPVNNVAPSGHSVVGALAAAAYTVVDTAWDIVDVYSDIRDCFGDSDSMACAMLPIDAMAVVALFAEGPSNNVARRAAKAAYAGDAAGDVGRRVDGQSALRQQVLANLENSRIARRSSGFREWADVFDPSRMPDEPWVAFEATLPSSMYPDVPARRHFQETNTQLLRAMDSGEVVFSGGMERSIRQQLVKPRSTSAKPPMGWTWHHAINEGKLWLVPSKQHWSEELWPVLHPGNKGGMSIWGGGY